jgi:hypothetical protein
VQQQASRDSWAGKTVWDGALANVVDDANASAQQRTHDEHLLLREGVHREYRGGR